MARAGGWRSMHDTNASMHAAMGGLAAEIHRQGSPPGIWNRLPFVAGQKCTHGTSSSLSARKRRWHARQSTMGSVKWSRWPLAFHTAGCIRMEASSPTMSARRRTLSCHHACLTLFFSSTPSGP